MRKYFLIFIQLFLAASLVVFGFTACTTSDDELEDENIEEEISSELGDIEAAEPGASKNDEASADASSDSGEEEISDADFEDDGTGGGDEDDDFFAEDADKPDNTDDLAEKDLDKELGKNASAADKTAAAPPPPPEPPAIYPENAPPAAPAPGGADAKTAGVTSKESIPGADAFEFINPNDPTVPKDDLGVSDPLVTDVDPPSPSMRAAKDLVPVSKIGRDPFYRNERLMNAVFIARPGDDLATISQKVFGEDKTALLLSDNPHIGKGVEAGDKVYYTSPNRADDRKSILTYYEDMKMAPAYYETEAGDDIQKIGRKVLGFEEAWKEVWAVNDSLQTQAMLPAGLKLRYWSGNENKKGDSDVASTATTAGYSEPPATSSGGGNNSPPPEDNNNLTATATEKEGETPIELPTTDSNPPPIADPSMAGQDPDTPPLLTDTASPAPSADSVSASNGGSLATIAGVAMVILAVMALVAIQIKNRKRPDDSIPPSLEFTKV